MQNIFTFLQPGRRFILWQSPIPYSDIYIYAFASLYIHKHTIYESKIRIIHFRVP